MNSATFNKPMTDGNCHLSLWKNKRWKNIWFKISNPFTKINKNLKNKNQNHKKNKKTPTSSSPSASDSTS